MPIYALEAWSDDTLCIDDLLEADDDETDISTAQKHIVPKAMGPVTKIKPRKQYSILIWSRP